MKRTAHLLAVAAVVVTLGLAALLDLPRGIKAPPTVALKAAPTQALKAPPMAPLALKAPPFV